MIISSDLLSGLTIGYQALLNEALAAAPKGPLQLDVEEICDTQDSTKRIETDVWDGFPPALQQFADRVQYGDLNSFSQTTPNLTYKTGMLVNREALEDDNLGLIRSKIDMLAWRIRQFKEKQLISLLETGFTATCYDGQYFFDIDHSEGDSGNQSNTDSNSLTADNLQTAIQGQELLVDDRGEELGLFPNLVLCGPKNRKNLVSILESERLAVTGLASTSAASTVGDANVVAKYGLHGAVSPFITGYHWFTLCTNIPGLKPLKWQNRIAPALFAATDPNDSGIIDTDVFKWVARLRAGKNFKLWQCATGHNASS